MIDFSLSKSKRKALPETVEVDGSAFSINAGFRTILRIQRMLNDDSIIESHKSTLLLSMFYGKESVPQNAQAAYERFSWFVRRGNDDKPQEKAGAQVFDYEQDAPEIYASFIALYGIDLFETDFHWWRFCALLDGAFRSECALSAKIRLRSVDASKCEDPGAVREAQEAIRIETKVSRQEKQLRDQLQDVLTSGGDVVAALEAMKHGL